MPWSRQLSAPIILKDGRIIATLLEARALMLNLPFRHQVRLDWQYAGELLHDAPPGGYRGDTCPYRKLNPTGAAARIGRCIVPWETCSN
jgi:hypothetical protein